MRSIGKGPFAAIVVKFRATMTGSMDRRMSVIDLNERKLDLLCEITVSWLASTYIG